MLLAQGLFKSFGQSYKEYHLAKIKYDVQESLGAVSGATSKEVHTVSKEEVDAYKAASLTAGIFAIIWVGLWLWAFYLLIFNCRLMENWEMLIMLIMLFVLGASVVVIIYILLVVKERGVTMTKSLKF
jgi:hypothetical protein